MKQKLQISILLLGLLTIYFACQKDDAVPSEQNAEQRIPKIKTVSYQEVGETFNRLTNKYQLDAFLDVGLDDNYLAKTTIDTLGITIYVDNIKEVSLDDYVSYTMLVATPNSTDSMFYNITIEDKNGETGIILTKYEPSQTWLADTSQKYEGNVEAKRVYDITRIGEELDDGGGGWNNTSYTEPSLEYPWDCEGLIITSYQSVTLCNCHNHIPEICGGCPYGYRDEELPHYLCVTMNDGNDDVLDTGTTDPVDTSNPNNGGPNGGSTEDDDNDGSYTALVDPTCPPGKIRNLEGDCVCPEGKIEDADGNCLCPNGYAENWRKNCVREGKCEELDKLMQSYPGTTNPYLSETTKSIRIALTNIDDYLSQNKEYGYGLFNLGDFPTYGPSANFVEPQNNRMVRFKASVFMFGTIHTHPTGLTVDGETTVPMFSLEDIYTLLTIRNNYLQGSTFQNQNNPNGDDLFVSLLVVNQGGLTKTYAIKIKNTNQLSALGNLIQNRNDWKDLIDVFKKKYEDNAENGEGSPNQYQKAFLELVRDNNLGVSLFEMGQQNSGTPGVSENWTELNLNDQGEVVPTPCNL